MKKIFVILLGAVILMSAVSCGNDNVVNNPEENGDEVSISVSEEQSADETEAQEVVEPVEKEIIVEVPEAVTKNDVTIMMDGIMAHFPGMENSEEKLADATTRLLNLSKVYTDEDEELVKTAVVEHISYLGDFQLENMKITIAEIDNRVQAMIAEENVPENFFEDGYNKVMVIVKAALGM